MKCASGGADLITRGSVAVPQWINQGSINKTQCTPKHFRRNFMCGSQAESICLSESVLLVYLMLITKTFWGSITCFAFCFFFSIEHLKQFSVTLTG